MEKLTNELHEKISSKVIWKIIWIKGEFKEKSIFSISWFINTFDLETMSTCNTFQPIWNSNFESLAGGAAEKELEKIENS